MATEDVQGTPRCRGVSVPRTTVGIPWGFDRIGCCVRFGMDAGLRKGRLVELGCVHTNMSRCRTMNDESGCASLEFERI